MYVAFVRVVLRKTLRKFDVVNGQEHGQQVPHFLAFALQRHFKAQTALVGTTVEQSFVRVKAPILQNMITNRLDCALPCRQTGIPCRKSEPRRPVCGHPWSVPRFPVISFSTGIAMNCPTSQRNVMLPLNWLPLTV